MGTPIAFNSGTTVNYQAGMFKRATVGLNLSTTLVSGTNWWNGVDVTNSQYLIYSDIYSQGQSSFSSSRPTAWSTPDLTDASLIALINTLPDRVGQVGFTTLSQAVNWLNQSGKYFLIKLGYENIVTSNLKVNMDAGWFNSYPSTGSTWTDLTVNAYVVTLYNSPAFSTADNGVINFDGSDDYGNFGQSLVGAGNTAYTVIVWCKRSRNNASYEELISQWTNAGSGNSFFFGFDNGNVRFTDSWNPITVPGAGKTNEWMCLVGVNTGSNAYIYLNGVLMATKGSALTYGATGPMVIGKQGELNSEYFSGSIGLIQIYDTALNSTQILQNFNAQAWRFGINSNVVSSGIVLNLSAKSLLSYPGSGTAWYDLSGQNNTTTLYNGPTYNSNGYITFDGSNDYGYDNSATGMNMSSTNGITADCFLYYSPSDFDFWFTGNNSGIKYRFGTNSSGNFYWDMGRHVDQNYGGYVLPSNTWAHVCFTGGLESGSIITRIYVNGSLITTNNEGISTLADISEFYVGNGESPGSHPFNGRISTLNVYNRTLSATEVKQNYYQGNILQDNLKFYFDAGNFVSYPATGTATGDLSGNSNTGTMINGPTFSSSFGGVIDFDGTDDYIQVPSTTSTNLSTYLTAEVWVYYEAGNGRIFQKDGESVTRCWEIGGYGGQFRMEMWHSNGVGTIGYGNYLAVNGWTHLTLTFDGTDIKMYQNAVLVSTINFPGDIRTDSNTPLLIGGRWSGEYFDGKISLARLYDVALTPIQISNNFNSQKSRFGF